MVVEADDDRGVIWTKPDDIVIDMKDPAKGLLGHYGNAAVLMATARFAWSRRTIPQSGRCSPLPAAVLPPK
jgi:hypothetical protein